VKRFLVLLGLLAAVVVAAGIVFLARPLATIRWFERIGLERAGLQERSVDTPAGTLTWWVGGDGPPVLLLHGAGDHAGTWRQVAGALRTRARLIAPDLPGHGKSGPPTGPLSLGTMADAIERILDAEAPGTAVVIVGNSLGGWLGEIVALRRPEAVARLILESGSGTRGEGDPADLIPRSREHAQQLVDRALGSLAQPVPRFMLDDMVRQASTSPVARIVAGDWEQHVLDGRLGDLQMPVDLVWGERDGIVPLEYARREVTNFRDARLHVVPGGGHVLHRHRSDEFVSLVNQILDDGRSPVSGGRWSVPGSPPAPVEPPE
jgi:pimeloyl-ACP methyl ester carboxylesterase